ncbi:succinylglutamate desuccinylase/aspartoacylase family protein [Candidatus Syntrophocurvum alkaliphilum]
MDMHEGHDYHISSSDRAFGQTFIYQPVGETQGFVERANAALNRSITNSSEHFSVLRFPAHGSLTRSTAEILGVNSFIFESTLKDDLDTRIDYQIRTVTMLLHQLNMIEVSDPEISETREVEILAPGTKYATELYIIDSGVPGPTVLIVGGIHGSEIAGYHAANKVKEYSPNKGTLLVIPEANKLAIEANRRSAPGEGDLNREFPTTRTGNPSHVLASAIYDVVKDYDVDWLMDMHEGFDFHRNPSTNSVGQTVIHYPNSEMTPVAERMVSELNTNATRSLERFTLLTYPVQGSLARSAGQHLGVNSFIFESCMKQDLSTRIDNQLIATDILLEEAGMR